MSFFVHVPYYVYMCFYIHFIFVIYMVFNINFFCFVLFLSTLVHLVRRLFVCWLFGVSGKRIRHTLDNYVWTTIEFHKLTLTLYCYGKHTKWFIFNDVNNDKFIHTGRKYIFNNIIFWIFIIRLSFWWRIFTIQHKIWFSDFYLP